MNIPFKRTKSFLLRNSWIIESLIAYSILIAIGRFFVKEDPGYLDSVIHPYWIVVLLIAGRYGLKAGILSGSIAAILYCWYLFERIPDRNLLEQTTEVSSLLVPIAFIVVGFVMGELRQMYIQQNKKLKEDLKKVQKELQSSHDIIHSEEKARQILESRIVGEVKTVRALYESAQKFLSMSRSDIYLGCLEVFKTHLSTKRSSIYSMDENYFYLEAAVGWDKGKEAEGKILRENSWMDLVCKSKKTLTARDLIRSKSANKLLEASEQPLAMIPLVSREVVVGVINVEDIEFIHLNKSNIELMNLIANWTSQSLDHANLLQSVKEKLIYDENLEIFSYRYCKDVLRHEFFRSKQSRLPFSIAILKLNNFGFMNSFQQDLMLKSIVALTKKHLRPIDLIFKYQFEGILVLVSPLVDMETLKNWMSNVENELMDIVSDLEKTPLSTGYAEWNNHFLEEGEMVEVALDALAN